MKVGFLVLFAMATAQAAQSGQCLLKTVVDPVKENRPADLTNEYSVPTVIKFASQDNDAVRSTQCPTGTQIATVISAYHVVETVGHGYAAGETRFVWGCYGPCEYVASPK